MEKTAFDIVNESFEKIAKLSKAEKEEKRELNKRLAKKNQAMAVEDFKSIPKQMALGGGGALATQLGVLNTLSGGSTFKKNKPIKGLIEKSLKPRKGTGQLAGGIALTGLGVGAMGKAMHNDIKKSKMRRAEMKADPERQRLNELTKKQMKFWQQP